MTSFRRYAIIVVLILLVVISALKVPLLLNDAFIDVRKPSLVVLESVNWQAKYSDSGIDPFDQNASSAVAELNSGGWIPLPKLADQIKESRYTGSFWIRLAFKQPISQRWNDPHLYLSDQERFAVYKEGKLLSAYEPDSSRTLYDKSREWYIVPLPPGGEDMTLDIRLYADKGSYSLGSMSYQLKKIMVGNAHDIYTEIVQSDWGKLILAPLFLLVALGAFIVFLLYRRERLYLYLFMNAAAAGAASIGKAASLRLLFDTSLLAYFVPLAELFLPFIFMALIEAVNTSRSVTLLRWGRAIYYALFAIALLNTPLYHAIQPYFPIPMYAGACYCFILLAVLYRRRMNTEGKLIFLGAGLLLFFAIVHLWVSDQRFSNETAAELAELTDDWLSVGTFALLLSFGMILVHRFTLIHRQVKQYAADLEHKNIRLEQLDRLKDDFLANTSHELRTPLYGIIGLAETLIDDAERSLGPEAKGHLQAIAASGQRLARLVNDILDFSRLKHHDMTLFPKTVDMKQAVQLAMSVVRTQAERKRLTLVNGISDDTPLVFADEDRVQQILMNLLGNAIKFTESGSVVVTAKREADWLRIDIADSGIGIAPEALDSIFEPFEQADSSAARPFGGTGLGLAVTKKLVQLHAGQLDVQSVPGQGSTFSFTLPLHREGLPVSAVASQDGGGYVAPLPSIPLFIDEDDMSDLLYPADGSAALLPSSESDNEPKAKRPIILVVDDEPINLRILTSHLGPHYTIVPFSSGADALHWLSSNGRPELIIADVMMPNMSGYELCRAVRGMYGSEELPVLMLSAKPYAADALESFDSGANDYVTKPVAKKELLARVQMQLELCQLNRSLDDQVRSRTAELEESNRQLHASMQETMHALEEVAVLEERNRIAHEVHDIVGHTLTATLVQIEAAKMLIDKDKVVALEKIGLVQQLIRRGLYDIRIIVRMLKDEIGQADLGASLRRLIKETERLTDVSIEYNVDELPPLGARVKKAIYHALQEGLTNGIKHGESGRFVFSLLLDRDDLLFTLENDGKPYVSNSYGFGLSAMADRVHQLHGSIELVPLEQRGCLLSIRIPLATAMAS